MSGLLINQNRLVLIENSWQRLNRKSHLSGLLRMREKVVSYEGAIKGIEDHLVRALAYDYIDKIAAKRRFLMEEIRWDTASKNAPQKICTHSTMYK
jgi:hypothetical protein